jgi:hypothetical protein
MRRAVLVPLAAVLVLGLVGLAAYWWWGVRTLSQGLEAWAAARRAEGYQVSLGRLETAGFPFSAVLRLEGPAITGPGGAWAWHPAALELRNAPWDPFSVVVTLDGDHALTAPDGEDLTAHVDSGEVALSATPDGGLDRITARLGAFRLAGPVLGALAGYAAELSIAPEGPSGGAEEPLPRFRVDGSVEGMTLPASPAPAFGREVQRIALETRVHGGLEAVPLTQALARWRDRGGLVEIRHGTVSWGALEVSGSGVLTLDQALQPTAELVARIRDFRDALAALAQGGAVTHEDAAMAGVALAVMAKSKDGDGDDAELPLSLRDQRVFAGPLAIMALPPVRWP